MNLESLKYHLIEKIVVSKDETLLTKVEQLFSETKTTASTIRKVSTPKKENGIVQRRSIYRISDRPTAVAVKTVIKTAAPKIVQPAKVIQTTSNTDSSLSKLQRLVRERALSNHALDV